jgi:hypothetical protein
MRKAQKKNLIITVNQNQIKTGWNAWGLSHHYIHARQPEHEQVASGMGHAGKAWECRWDKKA